MSQPARIELTHADFRCWRGMEERKFIEYADAFIESAVLMVERIDVWDLTAAELTEARERTVHA